MGVSARTRAREWFTLKRTSARLRSLTPAAKSSMVTATTPMNPCRKSRLSLTVPLANGPTPWAVFQIAMLATTNVAMTVPCCPNRRAAQIKNGRMT